jgi:tetratricopeptide (TPR) repeat protein
VAWSCSRRQAVAVALLLVLGLAAAPLDGAAQTPASLRAEAFDLAYNLDREQALARLDRALALDPGDAATHRAIASVTWLQLLFQRGAITVDHYLGSSARPRIDVAPPPPELDARFKQHVDRAVELARAQVSAAPRDPNAHAALGAALGLRASYTASIEGRLLAGFRAARGAFDAHEKVLDLDPSRHDAGLVVGTYRYLVATLSLPMRWMAYLAGFGGGKERGIQLIEQAAAFRSESRTEARFALLLVYNRERRYDEALAVLRQLQQEYPRNRLLWLEQGGTALRAGRAADAERALSEGMARLDADRRPRAGGEEAMWHYKRGAARVRLDRLDAARADLEAALAAGPPRWVRGRTQVEFGRIADLRGDRRGAQALYRQAAQLCEGDRDPLCADEARRLVNRAYRP